MAYQKGFYGAGIAGEDTGSRGLVDALGSMNKSMQKYGEYVGTELDKEVLAAAEKAARVDTFKSYQDQVDKGEIENTKSDFWIASYDNIKGKNHGSAFIVRKQLGYAEWIAEESKTEQLDLDGSRYLAWSQEFDKEELKTLGDQSPYFMKGFDPLITQSNQSISAAYSVHNSTRAKESSILEYSEYVKNILKDTTLSFNTKMKSIDTADQSAGNFRFLDGPSRDGVTVQEVKNYLAENLSPSDIDSDYDGGIDFLTNFIAYSRDNGSKYIKGKDIVELDASLEKLKQDRNTYDKNIILTTQGFVVDEFKTKQKDILEYAFFDRKMNKSRDHVKQGRSIAARALREYDLRLLYWLQDNQDADVKQKMEYIEQLRMDLATKHKGQDVQQMSLFDKEDFRGGNKPGSSFNIRGRLKDYIDSMNDYSLLRDELRANELVQGLSSTDKLKRFKVKYNGKIHEASLGADFDTGKPDPNSDTILIRGEDGRVIKSFRIFDETDILETKTEMESSEVASMARMNGYGSPDEFVKAYGDWEDYNKAEALLSTQDKEDFKTVADWEKENL